jgi:hypothetical protein
MRVRLFYGKWTAKRRDLVPFDFLHFILLLPGREVTGKLQATCRKKRKIE